MFKRKTRLSIDRGNPLVNALGYSAIIRAQNMINCILFYWVKVGHFYVTLSVVI